MLAPFAGVCRRSLPGDMLDCVRRRGGSFAGVPRLLGCAQRRVGSSAGVPRRGFHLDVPSRPRRNRKTSAIRDMVRETTVSPCNFVLPLFVTEGSEPVDIASMPGCRRNTVESLVGFFLRRARTCTQTN